MLNRAQKISCLLLFIPCFLINHDLNNDIWFILNCGRYVMQNGIPYIEPFTIHGGMSFVMQQWLSDIIFWSTYNYFGKTGLILIVILFYISNVYMTLRLCLLISENNFLISYTTTFAVTILIWFFMTQRPVIFLMLIILIELYSLEKFILTNNKNYLFMLIPLSVLLINMEAALWPMLFIILIPYFIDSFKFKLKFIKGQGYENKRLLIITIIMFTAGFINPYGLKAMTYLYYSYGVEEINNTVTEMSCANINDLLGKIIFITIFIVIMIYLIEAKKKYRLRYYLLALGTAYMAFSSVRNYSLFIVCGIIPASYFMKDLEMKCEIIKKDKKTRIIRIILIILLTVLIIFCIFRKSIVDPVHEDLTKTVDYIDTFNKKDLKLYTDYNEGGYLEFRGYRTYIDSRAEVFLKSINHKTDIFIEYYKLQTGKLCYKNILKQYNFDYLIVEKKDILYNYLDYDCDYLLIYSSQYHKIYKNKLNTL